MTSREFVGRSRLNRRNKALYLAIQSARPVQVGAAPVKLCRPNKLLRTGRGYPATVVDRSRGGASRPAIVKVVTNHLSRRESPQSSGETASAETDVGRR